MYICVALHKNYLHIVASGNITGFCSSKYLTISCMYYISLPYEMCVLILHVNIHVNTCNTVKYD